MTTENRKIQLETEVNATGATQGFEKVKQGARDMAQAVTQAGQQAGKGLDGIADGAKRAADGFTREEGRMRGAIQRATLDLKTLGKTASEKLEAKIDLQGLDASKFQPYLAALRQVEEAQRALQQKQTATAFTDGLQSQIATLQEQIRLQSMSTDEVLRYKAAQAGAAESAEPLIAKLSQLRRAQESVTEAARATAAAQKEAAAVANRQASFLDGLKQQADAIGKTRADLLELQAAQMGLTTAAAPYIARLREAERGHQALGAGAKLNAFQIQQLGFQLNDFAVQVMSGQSAITAFVQQGSQLSGTFGGAKNALAAVLSLLTPMRVAMIGGAAAVGGLALALSNAETAARGLNSIQAQLTGTGRGDLFAGGELKEFLDQLSQAPGVSREAASAIVSELSKVREIGGGMFKDLAGIAADYAKATGTDIPTAARALAKAFADPEKGARQLDEALGALSSTQLLQIERLTKLGDTAGAQRVLFQALEAQIGGLARNSMTPLQQSVDDLGNAWGRAMRELDQSQGLRTINELLGKTVAAVTFLIDNMGKLGGLSTVGAGMVPGVGLPSMASSAIRSLFGQDKPASREVSGRVGGVPATTPGAAAAAGAPSNKDRDDEIKRALGAAGAYRSQAGQIEELTAQRRQFNDALKESISLYGKDSEQAKRLREAIAGVNERIASVGRRGRGRVDREPDQIRREELAGELDGIQAAFERQRNQIAFQHRFLQGEYQAGERSLATYLDERRRLTELGVQAEIEALERRKQAIQKELDAPGRVKDPSERLNLGREVERITAQQGEVRERGTEQLQLANQEATASFKQLNDQVLAYRANLLQLQGDEEGAARIRAQIAIEQARTLARQSSGTAAELKPQEVRSTERAVLQQIEIQRITRETTQAQAGLQMAEERISQAQRTGAISTLESLSAVSEARRKAVADMEKLVQAQEAVAASRPQDYQLQIDTTRARHELEMLKGELDPLQQQFRDLFTDAGTDFLTSLMEGKGLKSALKGFGEMIARELNGVVARELSEQVFGKNGVLGGAGGFLADIFGGESRKQAAITPPVPTVDTAPVQSSLNSLAAGVNPATQALTQLTDAASAAAAAMNQRAALPPGMQDVQIAGERIPSVIVNPTTGDFARLDRGQVPAGEQSVMEMFRQAETSTEDYARSSALAASAVTQLASAAGKGNSALALLPGIINAIQAASAAAGSSSGGGIIGTLLGAMAGSSGAGYDSAAYVPWESEWSEGGFTGHKGVQEVAGVVHGQEYVFSAPAVKEIGLDRLDRLHKKAKAGEDVEDELPGYSDGGYVTAPGAVRPQSARRSGNFLVALQPVKTGDTHITTNTYPITVQAQPGMSRQTALQMGREVGRGIEIARARNGR